MAQRKRRARPRGKDTPEDREVFKFTNDGKLLMTIGHPFKGPDNNQDTTMLWPCRCD